jgi:hypothetical protein
VCFITNAINQPAINQPATLMTTLANVARCNHCGLAAAMCEIYKPHAI